ncbi:MAG: metal-dependent transcriptional regulator [Clostridia bacterium]|nr:metal-dependent transcriptional regulator [Clostridia bacterium]
MDQKVISRSKEDYLKAVFIAIKTHGTCRNVDISNHLGVSKASACIAVKKLEQDGFVKRDDLRILLTDRGLQLAEKLYEKDMFFVKWFKEIGVSEKTAKEDACMIEHVISEETYSKLRAYLKKNQLA